MAGGFVVVIPARLKSTRLPDKPLADIAGKPMVVRVAERALQCGASRVVVATDHASIVDACAAHGVEALLTRADHPSGTDRLAEVADLLALPDDLVVVNVQGDEPLIEPAVIDRLAATLAGSSAPMATVAHPVHDADDFFNPNVVKVVLDRHGEALYFSRAPRPWARDAFAARPDVLPPDMAALRHVGLYAYRAAFLRQYRSLEASPLESLEALEQLRVLWHGFRIAVTVLDATPAAGVDTPADLERVRQSFAAP